MNKYKHLIQKTITIAVTSVVIFMAFVGVYVGVSMLSDNAQKSKAEAESKYISDKSLLDSLTSQDAKSSEAEKRFAVLMDARENGEFSGRADAFIRWVSQTKEKLRLGMSDEIRSDPEAASKKAELVNLVGYDVFVRPQLKLDVQAISDVHVFSFIEELHRSAPGIVRVDQLTLKRTGDMSESTFEAMKNGGSSTPMVSATLEVSLIGIRPKEKENKPAEGAQGK